MIMENKETNRAKIYVSKRERDGQFHNVMVDLRRVVAIGKPCMDRESVDMYFENAIWLVSVDSYKEIMQIWPYL